MRKTIGSTIGFGVLVLIVMGGWTACSQNSHLYQSKTDFLGDRSRATGEKDAASYLHLLEESREPMSEWLEKEKAGYKGLEKGYTRAAKKFLSKKSQ